MTFSKKITFLIGGLLGSLTGLLFARKSGRDLRVKLTSARSNKQKFEVIFQEYLKVGEEALQEARQGNLLKKIIAGGEEVLTQLTKQKNSTTDENLKHARKKIQEILDKIKMPLKTKASSKPATKGRKNLKSKKVSPRVKKSKPSLKK